MFSLKEKEETRGTLESDPKYTGAEINYSH